MSAGDVAVLLLAIFWAVLVAFMAYVLVRLGKVLGATETLVEGVTDRTVPLLGEVTTSVVHVNEELERIDTIADNVQTVTTNVAELSTLFKATLGNPLVKVAALSYGLRRAAKNRSEHDLRGELKELRKMKKAGS